MKGSFRGVRESDEIKEPVLVDVGYYDTVRYGRLAYIVLLVPQGSKLIEVEKSVYEIIKVITPDGKVSYFYYYYGSAEEPDVVRNAREDEIREAEEALRLREIARKSNEAKTEEIILR